MEACLEKCKLVIYVFLTIVFELLFNILLIIFLPKESYYKKENLNNDYDLEKELSNEKKYQSSFIRY